MCIDVSVYRVQHVTCCDNFVVDDERSICGKLRSGEQQMRVESGRNTSGFVHSPERNSLEAKSDLKERIIRNKLRE